MSEPDIIITSEDLAVPYGEPPTACSFSAAHMMQLSATYGRDCVSGWTAALDSEGKPYQTIRVSFAQQRGVPLDEYFAHRMIAGALEGAVRAYLAWSGDGTIEWRVLPEIVVDPPLDRGQAHARCRLSVLKKRKVSA